MHVHHVMVLLVLVTSCGSTSGLARPEPEQVKARVMVRKVLQATPNAPPMPGASRDEPPAPSLAEVLARQPSPATDSSGRSLFETARATRQNRALTSDQSLQQMAMAAHYCDGPDPLFGNDDPGLPLVTCDMEAAEKYVLGPAMLVRKDFLDAVAKPNRNGAGHIVVLKVVDPDRLAQVTGSNVGQRLAFALNGMVLSAPEVRGQISNGELEISGAFSEDEASQLAAMMGNG